MKYMSKSRDDKMYFESENWKCSQSPTGAHYYVGTGEKLHCKYCNNPHITGYRTPHQKRVEEERNACKNS